MNCFSLLDSKLCLNALWRLVGSVWRFRRGTRRRRMRPRPGRTWRRGTVRLWWPCSWGLFGLWADCSRWLFRASNVRFVWFSGHRSRRRRFHRRRSRRRLLTRRRSGWHLLPWRWPFRFHRFVRLFLWLFYFHRRLWLRILFHNRLCFAMDNPMSCKKMFPLASLHCELKQTLLLININLPTLYHKWCILIGFDIRFIYFTNGFHVTVHPFCRI